MLIIKNAEKENLKDIAKISSENFSGLKNIKDAEQWIGCNFLAFPRIQYFIAEENGKIAGYIEWIEKGGFRENSVWELEQISVAKDFQGQGVGTQLINKSFLEVKKYTEKRGAKLKAIEITTGTDNNAQSLYKKTLGAESECVIKNLFRGDEIIMIARFE
ncbi:MAG: GNAT family N-acetyltransferase [Patescibacteria group bacterium]